MTSRTRKTGKQQVWSLSLDGEKVEPSERQVPSSFTKVIALWIPRRFLTPSGMDLKRFIADVNEKIIQRGLVLWDGQVLTIPITDDPGDGILRWDVTQSGDHATSQWIRVGKYTEVIYEPGAEDAMFQVPGRREWQSPQREFFGLDNPYQMAEDASDYTWSHVTTCVVGPYLSLDEKIAAIVDGKKDEYFFYCPCHLAEVVYTTRHRLVCMGCGATHVVLRDPLRVDPKRLLTSEEWVEFFDETGSRTDEEVAISVVDFQDVENAETIWTTDQWEEAKHRFIFFARSSPEEIAEAVRGTEADASIFLEAGFTQVNTSPPPAQQIAEDSIDIDLVENAAHALRDGVASFLAAKKNSDRLVNAIPQLFKAMELLLKARLSDLDTQGLSDRPNTTTVLKRIAAKGVSPTKDELESVRRLRRLRNDLQHNTARFNYRVALTACRKIIVFVDRFTNEELALWIGDAIPPDDWYQLLEIPEIARTAEAVVEARLKEVRRSPEVTVSSCVRCGKDATVRPDPRTGAVCFFCGHVPIYKEAG